MSKFYYLQESIDESTIGKSFPQIQSMSPNYNYNADNSIRSLKKSKLFEGELNLNSFKLNNGVQRTDFLSNAIKNFGFLISERTKNIFCNFRLVNCKFYPANVLNTEYSYPYFFMHIVDNLDNYIDFIKTEFFITDGVEVIEKVRFKNCTELIEERKRINPLHLIRSSKYQFISDFAIPFDIFQLASTDPRTYISHRLKTALEEANITGIEIIPTDII